ncbi:MAG: VOC family protein [bacterium]|nr:VOC family protein [bacterium]
MKLHHIGRVVKDLEEARIYYSDTFGLNAITEPVLDPIQKVDVLFLDTGHGDNSTIELICPRGEDSPVYKFLKKTGGGLHHLCFQVRDIHKAVEELKAKGALILGDVVPGKGHGDKPTVWLYTRSKELVELIEE